MHNSLWTHLHKVTKGLGGASGCCVDIINSSHLQHLLGCAGSHNSSTTGGRDQAHQHRSTLASHLQQHAMLTEVCNTCGSRMCGSQGRCSKHDAIFGTAHSVNHASLCRYILDLTNIKWSTRMQIEYNMLALCVGDAAFWSMLDTHQPVMLQRASKRVID